jgi:hypothetical protein
LVEILSKETSTLEDCTSFTEKFTKALGEKNTKEGLLDIKSILESGFRQTINILLVFFS